MLKLIKNNIKFTKMLLKIREKFMKTLCPFAENVCYFWKKY